MNQHDRILKQAEGHDNGSPLVSYATEKELKAAKSAQAANCLRWAIVIACLLFVAIASKVILG